MPSHSDRRVMNYSAQQMYDLVADVANYPKFLPWTAAARIRTTRKIEGGTQMDADLVISFKVFRERFTSRVSLFPELGRIDTEYLDGPFKHLHSRWEFSQLDKGCEVTFWVDFEFRNKVLQGAAGMFFNEAMTRIVKAFEERAKALYGD